MSLPTTEISKKLDDKQLTQTENNRNLHEAIISENSAAVDDALEKGANPNEPVVFKSGKKSTRAPITNAVYYANSHAVKKLIAYKANIDILVEDGVPLFLRAVQMGDSGVVNEFLNAGININTYFGMTALSQSILSLPTFSLIYQSTSTWSSTTNENSDAVQEKLENWYTDTKTNLPNGIFKVKFFGDISTIALLLSKNINAHMPGPGIITPSMLCQNPELFVQYFISINTEQETKFLSEQNHVLTFQRTITSRNFKKKVEVIVEYDFSRALSMIQAHIAQVGSISRRKSITDLLKRTEEKTNDEIEKLNARVAPVCLSHTIITAREKSIADYHKKVAISAQNPNGINPLGAFFDQFAIGLNATLLAIKTLYSGRVVREQYSMMDKIASATSALSSLLPFGTAGEVISTIIQKASDYIEAGKAEEIVGRIELDHTNFCKDLTLEIIKKYELTLKTLNPETARKMAEQTIETVVDRLGDKTPLPADLPLVQQLMPLLSDTNAFKQQCQQIASMLATKKKIKSCSVM